MSSTPGIPFSPKAFLRERRPENFSDSRNRETQQVDRNILEYHLDTLTKRNQETDFERFALKLAQLTICPNLRPQTGPTGGGDSKVDTETVPVADALALTWYVGMGRESANERWGFAFSAKRDWRPKVRSDIEKLVATNRGYQRAFFVSSQFIRDKDRAQEEDSLSMEHGIPVTILDRTWILDRVFDGKHELVAITELRLAAPVQAQAEVGPLDLQRKRQLEQLEKEIVELTANGASGPELVWKAIDAAILGRELELPRVEVEGRHARAIDLARSNGSDHQLVLAVYQHAWTAFWWHEDWAKFSALYPILEGHAKDSDNVNDLKLLNNAWHVLFSLGRSGSLPNVDFNQHLGVLSQALHRLSVVEEMPSSALEAKAMLLIQRVATVLPHIDARAFLELKDLLAESDRFVGFKIEQLVDLIVELGKLAPDCVEYDDLHETAVTLMARRKGEAATASALLSRSIQKLDGGRFYDAITMAGRTLSALWKDETRGELIDALHVCAWAYDSIGLYWAARGSLLNATALMSNRLRAETDIRSLRPGSFATLKLLELRLGRIPHALAWHEVECVVRRAQGEEPSPREDALAFEAGLGLYFLRANLDQLRALEGMPEVLLDAGLPTAATALFYALGWPERIPAGYAAPSPEEMFQFFELWCAQPISQQLSAPMELGEETRVILNSRLLGCIFQIDAENDPYCLLLGESLLAALESCLATAHRERVVLVYPQLRITISRGAATAPPFTFEVSKVNYAPQGVFSCPERDPYALTPGEYQEIKKALFTAVSTLLAHVLTAKNLEVSIERLFGVEKGFERAVNFTGSFLTLGTVLGNRPRMRLSAWVQNAPQQFPLKRTSMWNATSTSAEESSSAPRPTPKPGRGIPPPEKDVDHRNLSHHSIINVGLWNNAKWRAAGYCVLQDEPPILALGFKNEESARQIFSEWREQFGSQDKEEVIRIAIVRGIKKANRFAYRVAVGKNLPAGGTGEHFVLTTRSNTMEPKDDSNLSAFLKAYEQFGRYRLSYTVLNDDQTMTPISDSHFIEKTSLVVREAWTIGLHDPDCMGINADDDPIVSNPSEPAPVLELIEWLKQNQG